MKIQKNSISFNHNQSNYKIDHEKIINLSQSECTPINDTNSNPNYITYANLVEDNFYIMPVINIKSTCPTPETSETCYTISPIVNNKYYRYDTYTNDKYILPVPIYAQRPVFFYLWEIFQSIDLGFLKSSNPLNILSITDVPTYFKHENKLIPLPDIIYSVHEYRKKILKESIHDYYDTIYITDTIVELDTTYFKSMFMNIKMDQIKSISDMSVNKKFDLIICWTDKIKIIFDLVSKMMSVPDSNLIFNLEINMKCVSIVHEIVYYLTTIFTKVTTYIPVCAELKKQMIIIICQKLLSKKSNSDSVSISNQIPLSFTTTLDQFITDQDRIMRNTRERIYELDELFKEMNSMNKQAYLFHARNSQIKFAENWCKKFHMQIHPFYFLKESEPVLSNKSINFSKIFPPADGVDRNKMLMTDIGLYSITPYQEADEMVDIIARHVGKSLDKLVITESNGGLGGNTIAFAKKFKRVNTAEYSNLHCDILRNNIGLYKFTNVHIYCASYLYVFENLKQDILFMDPAWSGPGYKYVRKLYLYIGEYMIEDIINWIRDKIKIVVIKAPFNYDIEYFKKRVKNTGFVIHKIRNYQLLIVDL